MQRPDDGLLHRVDILVLVDDDVLHPFGEVRSYAIVISQQGDCLLEDRRVVEVVLLVEHASVVLEAVENRARAEVSGVAVRLAEDG